MTLPNADEGEMRVSHVRVDPDHRIRTMESRESGMSVVGKSCAVVSPLDHDSSGIEVPSCAVIEGVNELGTRVRPLCSST